MEGDLAAVEPTKAWCSEKIDKIAPDLIVAQTEIQKVYRSGENPYFDSSYATLENVLDAVKPILNEHNIAIYQAPEVDDSGRQVLASYLIHTSGQWFRAEYLVTAKDDEHKKGSSITYGARYCLKRQTGCSETDDDGNNAVEKDGPVPGLGGKPTEGNAAPSGVKGIKCEHCKTSMEQSKINPKTELFCSNPQCPYRKKNRKSWVVKKN